MNNNEEWKNQASRRYQALLLAHGSAILFIALLGGLMLVFAMMKGVVVWPLVDIPANIPGSVRGWKAAHVGGITNALLLMGMSFALSRVPLSFSSQRFVFWSFILTGWGNTIFYLAGNLAANRGISFQSNSYGESDIAGIIAFGSAGSAMVLTIIATYIVMRGAFRLASSTS